MKKLLVMLLILLTALMVVSAESLKPYRVSGFREASVADPIRMAGDSYTDGYYFSNWNGTMLYNLRSQYRTMTCLVGPTEDASVNREFQIDFYVDNVLAKTVVFTGIDLPVEVEVDLNYMRQLRIQGAEGASNEYAITNIDFK